MAILARHLLAFALMGALMTSALANADDDEDGGDGDDAPVLEVSTGINCEDGLVVPLWPVGDGLAPGEARDGYLVF